MTHISPGTEFGPFRVEALVGAGGMGRVYRAHDTKLNRRVALKILPEQFATDADRLARFQREAQTLASLNHPHIAQIYGLEDTGGPPALVMELVEGQTLADRLVAGGARPMPLAEALRIARQIADALDAAHEKGIVHRDLKPANVMVTPEGHVKVLDFGLAKLAGGEASEVNQSQSPTVLTVAGTRAGVLLGTVAYMSPEQARGRHVDKRTDIWAFGCVLYEMLTGRAAFAGETVSDTIARILEREPNWNALPSVPPQTRRLLQRCLDKDTRGRLRDIGDAQGDLDETAAAETVSARPGRSAWIGLAAGAVGVLLAAVALVLRPGAVPVKAARLSILPPPGTTFTWRDITEHPQFALSPDGSQLAVVAAAPREPSRIWIRSLETGASRSLSGTEGASGPFWSPDGSEIAFLSQNRLKKIGLTGGTVQNLADTPFDVTIGAWSPTGVILFTRGNGSPLFRVPANGGAVTAVTSLNKARNETAHRFPQFLPDGRRFIVYAGSATPANAGVHIGSIDSSNLELLLASPTSAVFADPDSLLYEQNGTITRQTIDAQTGKLVGDPVSLGDAILGLRGPAYLPLSIARNGTLAYWSNRVSPSELRWFDRTGRPLDRVGRAQTRYDNPVLSPDGTKVLATLRESQNSNEIWRFDLASGAASRVTFTRGVARFPIWGPDGQTIAFSAADERGPQIFQRPTSGAGEETRLEGTGRHYALFPDDWSQDRRWLFFDVASESAFDVWVLDVVNRHVQRLLQSPANEVQPHLSPDGRWLAYASDETGAWEVYVRGFGDNRGQWQVSTAGGSQPIWRGDGRELFFVGPDGRLFAAAIERSTTFEHRPPQALFETTMLPMLAPFRMGYAVSPDGQRFLINTLQNNPEPSAITVVLNWDAALRR